MSRSTDMPPKLGRTGRYPDGKIHPDDKGEIRFAIGNDERNVLIDFGPEARVSFLAMGPHEAKALAKALIEHAERIEN